MKKCFFPICKLKSIKTIRMYKCIILRIDAFKNILNHCISVYVISVTNHYGFISNITDLTVSILSNSVIDTDFTMSKITPTGIFSFFYNGIMDCRLSDLILKNKNLLSRGIWIRLLQGWQHCVMYS